MMDFPIGTTCTRGVAAGSLCPRPAEVKVHFVDMQTGETNRRDEVCALHAFEAVGRAFVDLQFPERQPCTVIVAPL